MHKLLIFTLSIFFLNAAIAQTVVDKSFFDKADSFWSSVVNGRTVDYVQIKENPSNLLELVQIVDNADVTNLDETTLKAFYINAYNLAVIKGIVLNYPVQSVQEIPGFFDQVEHKFSGKFMTLNKFEKELILKKFDDPRLHFVLVCGANGCPPITNKAYRPEILDLQLDDQSKAACNDPNFIKTNGDEVGLSKIFEWYTSDFGGSKKSILKFINNYRKEAISNAAKVYYYDYDWSLNSIGAAGKTIKSGSNTNSDSNTTGSTNASSNSPASGSGGTPSIPNTGASGNGGFRYIVSALYEKGQYEINLFNNLYHEKKKNDLNENVGSSTFFTTLTQFLFGINSRINAGFDLRFRSVGQNYVEANSPFEVLKFPKTQLNYSANDPSSIVGYSRIGLTALGPKIKYTPFKNYGNISFQHTLYIPVGKDLSGNVDKGYIDWNGGQLWTQLFYDQSIGNDFGLFVEADLNFENVGKEQPIQFSTPLTIIPSYFPNNETTIYGLIGSAPQWYNLFPSDGEARLYNPFSQYGLGIKYLIANKFQVELLVTEFINSDSNVGRAATYNFGLRYINR